MATEAPTILINKNGSPHPRAIRAYWLTVCAAITERRFEDLHRACVTYLLDTDRITEAEAVARVNHPPPMTIATTHLECGQARHADGDQTLWSDPPKTWLS